MAVTPDVQLTLALADSDLDPEDLEALTQTFYQQLNEIATSVERLPVTQPANADPSRDWLPKGEKKGLLQMEINLDSIQTLATWLYRRLAGKSTKAKLKFGEGKNAIEFEFDGNSQKDLAATMADVTTFVEKITQMQQAKQQS